MVSKGSKEWEFLCGSHHLECYAQVAEFKTSSNFDDPFCDKNTKKENVALLFDELDIQISFYSLANEDIDENILNPSIICSIRQENDAVLSLSEYSLDDRKDFSVGCSENGKSFAYVLLPVLYRPLLLHVSFPVLCPTPLPF